jgi:signal peptidase I
MYPSYKHGDVILALKSFSKNKKKILEPGDVAVFFHGGYEKLKRVIQVSDKGYFMIGDNLEESTDSRSFGLVKSENVVARVVFPRR